MSSAIADVSETLIQLLRTELAVSLPSVPSDQIDVMSPAEKAADTRLTLFLYSAVPTAALRNEFEIPGNTIDDEPVSLPLDLYYLMTAFSPVPEPTQRSLDAQLLLGHAMRVFFENGILTGSILKGNLPRDEELRLTLQPITVEDLNKVWSLFPDTILQTSVSYLVTPARLRSTRTRGGQRVVARQTDLDQIVPIPREGVA